MTQQVQTQQQVARKRRRISKPLWIVLIIIAGVLVAVFWILIAMGRVPVLLGMSPTVQGIVFPIILTVVGLILGAISIIPNDGQATAFPEPQTQPPVSPPININVHYPPYPPTPQPATPSSPLPQPVNTPAPDTASTTTAPVLEGAVKRPSGSLSYHQEPTVSTNPQTIQQREATVQEVYQQVIQQGISSVVLIGIGGQGKSTLAALVFNYAEQQRKEGKGLFQDAALWFDVGQDMPFSELASELLRTLDIEIADFKKLLPREQALTLFHAIKSLHTPRFIVLNQFENMLDWSTGKASITGSGVDEFVDALNSNACACRLLLTSRPMPAGTHAQLQSCLRDYPVGGLAIDEGMKLLRQQGMKPQQATDEELREAVKRCDGHAYALVFLATLLHNRSLTVNALFTNPNYNHKWGEQIARQLLDDIVQRLTLLQRDLLLAFSIYREPVPIEAARAILSTRYTNEQEQTALDALYNQHLLQSPETPTPDNPCYQLHKIVIDYAHTHFDAANKAANEQALREAHEKAAHYYVELGQTLCPEPDKRRKLEDVQPFVEAVRHYCDAEQWQEAFDLFVKENLFSDLSRWGENVLLLALCLPFSNKQWKPETHQEALLYSYLGFVYDDLGDKQKAIEYFEQALTLMRVVGDRGGEGTTLNNLGRVYNALGDKPKALEYFEQALTLMRAVGDRGGEGTTLNNLGRVYDDLGDKQKAIEYYEQALTLSRAVGDRAGEATTLHNVGTIYFEQGKYKIALAHFYVARELFIRVQSPNRNVVQSWIDDLQSEVGDEQFKQLLTQVEPRAQEIVDEALRDG